MQDSTNLDSTRTSNIKIKTCGLFRTQDIEYANILKPDFIGFIFAPSKRQVSPKMAQTLKQNLDSSIKAVGVFVDFDVDLMLELLDSKIIDIIQLHNNHSEDFIKTLKSRTSAPIIKAISVKNAESIFQGAQTLADFILLDNAKGGSGVSFDWNLLKDALDSGFDKPYFLAGGINATNIKQALNFKPYAIDVSGGLEENGVKSFAKMQEIINEVRNAK